MIFTIITPNLNQGCYLTECMDSVQAQVSPGQLEVEHLVVDGGSEDSSLNLLRSRRDRLLSWTSEPDRGQSDAINKGLAAAQGDILAYLCADDFYETGTLARVARVFRDFQEVDVVYGDFYFMEGDSGWKRLKKAGPFSVSRLRKGNFLGQPSVFWRRRVYERFGGFDPGLKYCMDHEYWLRICGGTRWYYLTDALATCRLHGGSKTGSQLVAMWDEAARMGKKYGVGERLARAALWMRFGGQGYYQAKRIFLGQVGRWLMRKKASS